MKYSNYEKEYNVDVCAVLNPPILLDEGIIMPDDTLITSGKVLELLREWQRLVANRDWKGFLEASDEDVWEQFDEGESRILRQCVLDKRGGCFIDVTASLAGRY